MYGKEQYYQMTVLLKIQFIPYTNMVPTTFKKDISQTLVNFLLSDKLKFSKYSKQS